MSGQYEDLNLLNIGGGVVPELFDHELKRIVKNLADPNMKHEAVREINIKIKIQPVDANTNKIEISCEAKLAPKGTSKGTIYLARNGNMTRAFHHDPGQRDFFDGAENIAEEQTETA